MPLQPTKSQEDFFSIIEIHGKEGHTERYHYDEKSIPFLYLRKEEAKRKFFSLFHGRDNDDEPVPEGNGLNTEQESVDRLANCLELHGIDDFNTARGIQQLILRANESVGADEISQIEKLSNGVVGSVDFIPGQKNANYENETHSRLHGNRSTKDTWQYRDHSDEIIASSVQLLQNLNTELSNTGSILEEHGLIDSVSQVQLQIDICSTILSTIQVTYNGRVYHCSSANNTAMPFEEIDKQLAIERQSIESLIDKDIGKMGTYHGNDEIDIDALKKDPVVCSGFAKSFYIQHLGLDKYLQYFQYIAVLFEYAAECKKEDAPRYGSAPTFLTETDGLTFTFKKFIHPQRAEGKTFMPDHDEFGKITSMGGLLDLWPIEPIIPKAEVEPTEEEKAREDLWSHLENEGCLQWREDKGEDEYYKKRKEKYLSWYPGLSRNGLVATLERYNATEKLGNEVLAYYDAYGFNPFQELIINSRQRIHILTGANSNGKSTLMRSVALCLNTGMTGRKIQSVDSEMSFCDGIYHDFEVHDDIQEGMSTFRAQVKNVLNFLKNATPNSLGLFDEMYHGTSSLYLLALAWSTVESISRRKLRAIISTHEPLLTFSTRGDGLDLLQGIYANQRKMIGGQVNGGIEGVSNISLRNHYELRDGAVMDSNAFRVAKEEKMPTKIIKRAEHIKAVLMGEA